MFSIEELNEKIKESECVLVGIGSEFNNIDNSENDLLEAYSVIASMLDGKNYFVVNECDDKIIRESSLDSDRIALPVAETVDGEDNEMWDKYLRWLSCTLNKKLLLIELGVDFSKPQIIRWPFEKTVMFNNKAILYRINDTMPNIPPEIKEKAVSIKENAINMLISN